MPTSLTHVFRYVSGRVYLALLALALLALALLALLALLSCTRTIPVLPYAPSIACATRLARTASLGRRHAWVRCARVRACMRSCTRVCLH